MKKRILWIGFDITIAAAIILAVWMADYVSPKEGIRAAAFPGTEDMMEAEQETVPEEGQGKMETQANFLQSAHMTEEKWSRAKNFADAAADGSHPAKEEKPGTEQEISADGSGKNPETESDLLQRTRIIVDTQDWHEKFADKFTDTVVATDTSYSSPNLSIQLSYSHYDTGILDLSESGKHKKYGTEVSYVLADIYVGDITCFQTAFARDTYGVGYTEKLSDMSAAMKAVLAVNGDSYSNNRNRNNGTIIRNGVVYRGRPTDVETCVLNWDGTMDIYGPDQLDLQQLVEKGAYQSWIFGPSLLDENGKAKQKDSFLTWSYIEESHPRTAIGYFEPGHYCLLLADGRQKSSRGMFLEEMAKVFEDLGCRAAYNLDGGHCSFMTFQDRTANHPYKPEHEVPDGIFITEGL